MTFGVSPNFARRNFPFAFLLGRLHRLRFLWLRLLWLFGFLWFFGFRKNRFGFGLRLWFWLNRLGLGLRIGSRALLSHGVVHDSRFPVPHKFKAKMPHSRLLLRIRFNRDAEISTFISIRQIGGKPRCVTGHQVCSCGGEFYFNRLSACVGIPYRR